MKNSNIFLLEMEGFNKTKITATVENQFCPSCIDYRHESLFNNWIEYKGIPICQMCEEWIIYSSPFCKNCDNWEKCCKNNCVSCDRHDEYKCNFCNKNYEKEIEKLISQRK